MGGESDIVVQAWTPRFVAACDRLLRIEGGYVNDPADRGGETMYGISLRFLVAEGRIDADFDGRADFDLDMDGDIDGADIRRLSVADARALYARCFWNRLRCDNFPRPLGEALFDQAVNGGLKAAKTLLQRAVNRCLGEAPADAPGRPAPLEPDGAIGARTLTAMEWVLRFPGLRMPALITAYRRAAADRYRAIVERDPAQKRFLRGWLLRASELGAA